MAIASKTVVSLPGQVGSHTSLRLAVLLEVDQVLAAQAHPRADGTSLALTYVNEAGGELLAELAGQGSTAAVSEPAGPDS